MRKIKIIGLIALLLMPTIKEVHASEPIPILFTIKNDEHMYFIEFQGNNMKVKPISTKLYIPIPCLSNEKNTINTINFPQFNPCLLNAINKELNTKINHYIHLDMNLLLKDLKLPKNTYDYKTLASLTKTTKKIKDHFSFSILADYKKYIETNLTFQDLYHLYKIATKKLKIKYYYLNYYVIDDIYLLFDTHFYKKTKSDK